MSQPIRWSVSVDKETDAIADILQRAFAEYVGENRSGLVKFIFKRFHRSMASNVAAQIEREQGINQEILSEEITNFNNEFPAHPSVEGRAKPLTRIKSTSQQTPGARRREVRSVSQFRAVDAAKGMAWVTSLALNSTRFSRRVA